MRLQKVFLGSALEIVVMVMAGIIMAGTITGADDVNASEKRPTVSVNAAETNSVYNSGNPFLDCELSVEQDPSTGQVHYKVGPHSRVKFEGYWLDRAGSLPMAGQLYCGFDAHPCGPRELLIVWFGEVDGKIQPVEYEYRNVTAMNDSYHVQPITCPALKQVR
ncbi:MAG: hypothetical protein AB7G93_14240 [Bdellovibrionales bacterium]